MIPALSCGISMSPFLPLAFHFLLILLFILLLPSAAAAMDAEAAHKEPLAVPYPARSYVIQSADAPDGPHKFGLFSWTTMTKTDLWTDGITFILAVATALMSLFISVFRSGTTLAEGFSENLAANEYFTLSLFIFTIMYPIITPFLLLMRSLEISAKKEAYYALLKYGIILNL
jgi:hypothetical protein